ncbi:O-antigen ligase family protein [Glycocaulis abyssi]|uniref:O-antigen ligase family protein n=1 Tax=Glycocaulis abyssi TaxID=1433403 RepID=A0ABV9NDT9_9PROT
MTAYALRDVFGQQGRASRTLVFRLFLITACVLIATAPIYWLPGIPLPVMAAVKNAAFFGAVGLAILVSGMRFIQLGIAFPFIVAATLNFIAFQINGSAEYATYQALSFLAPMAWVLAICSLRREQVALLLKYLPLPLGLIALAVAYAFLAKFGAVPDFRPPAEGLQLQERQLSGFQRMATSTVGFHFTRTGWGTGSGMALILLGTILIGRNRQWLGLAVLTLAVLAPAAMGGRGAALGAMAAFALAVLTMRQLGSLRILLVPGMVLLPVLATDYLVSAGILSERFFNIQSNSDWFVVVDQATTGRLTTWITGIETFAANPVVGGGVEASWTYRQSGEILAVHNAWLAFLSEGGLMAFLPAVFIFLWASRVILRVNEFRPLITFVVVISMVEPGVMFGSFGNQVSIWTAVGLAMHTIRK